MSSKVPEAYTDAPVETQGLFPGLWWNHDRYEAREERVAELKEQIPQSDAIGIVDTDADGLACEVVLRSRYDNPTVIQANGGSYAISLTHALDIVAENAPTDIPVILADLSPDTTFSGLKAGLAKVDSPLFVYDHHDWEWTAKTSIECVVEELVIDDDKCAAQIVLDEQHSKADEQLREFVDVTADHDLWIKEDERSDHLSTLSFQLSRDEYIDAAFEYGANMVRDSKELQGVYGESERQAQERARIAVDKAEWHDINGETVAVTYFDAHQSRVGEQLIDQGADLAVIIQPTLGISFRSTEEFGRCADLARGLGGGGHADSAGAGIYSLIDMPDVLDDEELAVSEFGEDMIDTEDVWVREYVWRTEGRPAIDAMVQYLEDQV